MLKGLVIVIEETKRIYSLLSTSPLTESYKVIALNDQITIRQSISQSKAQIIIIDVEHPHKMMVEQYLKEFYPLLPIIYVSFLFGYDYYYSVDFSSNKLIEDINLEGLLYKIENINNKETPLVEEGWQAPILLTPQEERILKLLEKGYTNKEIAHQLGLMETTVKTYNYILFQKLSVKNRTQAILVAKKAKII